MGRLILRKVVTRRRGRWASGGAYDVTNRFGDGSLPGREDYALVLGHDAAEVDPSLDHSRAHERWADPAARVGFDKSRTPARLVATIGRTSGSGAFRRVFEL